jgi:peptidoglycan LD-endopeptidase LytH
VLRVSIFVIALVIAAFTLLFFTADRVDPGAVAPEVALPSAAPQVPSAPTAPIAPPPAQPPTAPTPAQPAVVPPSVTPPAEPLPQAPIFSNGNSLLLPVTGIRKDQLVDTYTQSRGSGRVHEAIDIMAPTGTPVVAVDDGKVVKLFNSKQGGLTVYQFDRHEKLAYYYAHLDRYAAGVVEGRELKRGDLVGYVGSTGNARPDAPHLHFAIFALGPEKQWWKGTAINPYPLLAAQ